MDFFFAGFHPTVFCLAPHLVDMVEFGSTFGKHGGNTGLCWCIICILYSIYIYHT